MVVKYVRNWYSVLAVYTGTMLKTNAKFKDGIEIELSKNNYNEFYEEIYSQYLQDKGFTYKIRTKEKTMIQTPNGLQIIFSQPPYSFVLDEIFVMKVYGEPEMRDRTVIDVGASIGDSALYFASLGASIVYGFEPNFERYELAKQNVDLNNLADRVQLFNEEATAEVLRNLIIRSGSNNIFLKIDCDGCEYELIENSDTVTFDRVTTIALEYHGKPEPLIERMGELGFNGRRKKEIIFALKK